MLPRYQPRKFPPLRHQQQRSNTLLYLLPIVCILLLVVPHVNISSIHALLPTPIAPHAPPPVAQQWPVITQATQATQVTQVTHPSDSDLQGRARRARQLPPCAATGEQAQSFLMIFMGHSASTSMIAELRNHTQVYVEDSEYVDHQEVFNTTEALIRTRHFFMNNRGKGRTPGFKIRPMHVLHDPEGFRKLVRDFKTRVLWNYRQNLFKATIGEYGVRYLNDTAGIEGLRENLSHKERCKRGVCSFRVRNFTFLHQTLREKTKSHHAITLAANVLATEEGCVREIPYEDYLYDRDAVLVDIQKFLGLKQEVLPQGRFKATSDNMCEVVENWKEVCKKFYGCLAWQHMMDDAKNKCFCPTTWGDLQYCDSSFEMPNSVR